MKNFLPIFKDESLLIRALTHRSALNEGLSTSEVSNERLEFLGDAVLELATTKFLFARLSQEPEGVLTAYRSALVKTGTLAAVARELGIGQQILMSKGEEATGGRENESLLADTMEAIIGAMYLDQGFEHAEQFLQEHLFPLFTEVKEQKLYQDGKSQLQEVVQAKGFPTPTYQVINETGPDHDKEFTVQVLVNKKIAGKGMGKSKQLAQQAAAREALEKIDEE